MNRTSMARTIVFLLILFPLGFSTTALALPDAGRTAQQTGLPQITFLGQGPQTFTIEPPLKFLVKTYQNGQFLFVARDGPTYTARREERVWTIDTVPAESIRLFDEERSYGNVEAGCVVNYVQIEDNVDTRRNTFFINGNTLQVVEQGMVTYGSFTVPESGELTFFAEDSIGMVIELCQTAQTVVPSETPTATSTTLVEPTETTAFTATATEPAVTPTVTSTAEIILISETPTVTTTEAPTATSTPPAIILTITPTSTPQTSTLQTATPLTATSTSPSSLTTPSATPQIILITATPAATLGSFPVTGGAPGPRETAVITFTLIALFLLVGAAWWFLIRAYVHRR